MNTRDMLRFAQDAVTECQAGHITRDSLAQILEFFACNAREVRALPGAGNVGLRTVGARLDGWLHSIHDPEVIGSRPLLLVRLQQIAAAAQELVALEDERDCAIPALPGNVVAFPVDRPAALRAGLPA